MNIKIIVLIIILILLLLLLLYTILIQIEEGQNVPLIYNKYLPSHLEHIVPYNDFDRAFNPSIFQYDKTIYYTHRIHRGKASIDKGILKYISKKTDRSRTLITNNINRWLVTYRDLHIDRNGFQDPRAIVFKNKYLLLIANDEDLETGLNQMYVLQFLLSDLKPSNTTITPIKIINLKYGIHRIQKNWMPFVHNEELHFIYNMNQFIILRADLKTGSCEKIIEQTYSISRELRGGSNVISWKSEKFGNVYLGITHTRYVMIYVHNFFIFNSNLRLIAVSDSFIIKDKHLLFVNEKTLQLFKSTKRIQDKIQYVAGILQQENNFHITYGESDFYSKEFVIDSDEVSKILKQI